tara:strand:+ start:242 stop:652 length:411 start_codon:yes stop_codon:yes gene_type:complete
MDLTTLGKMQDNQTFIMPWRKPGARAGKIIRIGHGSVDVHIPKYDGNGWERTAIALETEVIPCDEELYHQQGFGDGGAGGRTRNKSTIKKPVDIVWGLCKDMTGATRDEIVKACVALGVNQNTAKTQYYHWRKKHG